MLSPKALWRDGSGLSAPAELSSWPRPCPPTRAARCASTISFSRSSSSCCCPAFCCACFAAAASARNSRSASGAIRREERQRFANGTWLWLHSISVGETLLALKLARQMRALDPATRIALSVTTSTGFAVAREAACDWLEVIYNPLDLPGIRARGARCRAPAAPDFHRSHLAKPARRSQAPRPARGLRAAAFAALGAALSPRPRAHRAASSGSSTCSPCRNRRTWRAGNRWAWTERGFA